MSFEGGPYIQAACFCDLVIQESSGVLSLIRVIDTLTRRHVAPDAPESMPPFVHTFWMVIMLKSGNAMGRHELRIVPELPSGATEQPLSIPVHLDGGHTGHNVVMQTSFQFALEGLYWFNVDFDGERLTRIPLLVRYEPVIAGIGP